MNRRPTTDTATSDTRLGTRRRLRDALRPVLAAAVLAASIAVFASPADAAVARPSGIAEYGSDLQCGNGTVLEGLALATDAAPGQTAWQITEILVHRDGAWRHHGWSDWRHASVNGYGTAGPHWTTYGSNHATTTDIHHVPHGWVALRQLVYADGAWTARNPVASNGMTICHA